MEAPEGKEPSNPGTQTKKTQECWLCLAGAREIQEQKIEVLVC